MKKFVTLFSAFFVGTLTLSPVAVLVAQAPVAQAAQAKNLQGAAAPTETAPRLPVVAAGEIVVKLKNSAAAQNVAQGNGMQVEAQSPKKDVALLQSDNSSKTVREQVQQLDSDPNVEYAQPNYVYTDQGVISNDTYRSVLYGLDIISAPQAWSIADGSGVIVAVVDTGTDFSHPDLQANAWNGANCVDIYNNPLGGCQSGYDFEDNDPVPAPVATDSDSFHGTHVAGTIAAQANNIGIVGVAPNAKIMALRSNLSTFDNVRAIEFAQNNGAKIINASWGGAGFDQALHDAIASFSGLFVAAAGNSSQSSDLSQFYPCAYDLPNVICVAATDSGDNLASFSNYGSVSVDVGAPGVNIASTMPGGAYAYASGTSMAAPHVSGEAALIWSYDPALTTAQVKDVIMNSGNSVASLQGRTVSGKRINAFAALNSVTQLLQLPQPSPTQPAPAPTPAPTNPVVTQPAPTQPSQPSPTPPTIPQPITQNPGPVITPKANPDPEGTLINFNGTIYYIAEDGRRGIPSMSVFNSYGFNLAAVKQATDADMQILEGPLVLPKNTIAKSPNNSTVYLLTPDGTKRGFTSYAAFLAMGLNMKNVKTNIDLSQFIDGVPIW